MTWHCGKNWKNEGLNLGTRRLGQALTLLLELCFLTLRAAIWRSPRGRLKTAQDLEVSKLVEPSFWENGGSSLSLSRSKVTSFCCGYVLLWASGWEAQEGWARGLINRCCGAWPSGVTVMGSWVTGSR